MCQALWKGSSPLASLRPGDTWLNSSLVNSSPPSTLCHVSPVTFLLEFYVVFLARWFGLPSPCRWV